MQPLIIRSPAQGNYAAHASAYLCFSSGSFIITLPGMRQII